MPIPTHVHYFIHDSINYDESVAVCRAGLDGWPMVCVCVCTFSILHSCGIFTAATSDSRLQIDLAPNTDREIGREIGRAMGREKNTKQSRFDFDRTLN